MQGQANHFVAFAPVKLDYPIKRYVEETYRLFGVLEIGLQNADYLANDKYSIADIASFPWVVAGFFAGASRTLLCCCIQVCFMSALAGIVAILNNYASSPCCTDVFHTEWY